MTKRAIYLHGKANVGIFNCGEVERTLKKTEIKLKELPTLAFFNNRKSKYEKFTKSLTDFKSYEEMKRYCDNKLSLDNK